MANATTTLIRATSRASCKIRDNYYTVEYCEERAVKEGLSETELEVEREELWNTVNAQCDNQVEEIIKTFNSTH